MNKLHQFFESNKRFADIFIRAIIGFHLIHGVHDNILSWDRMTEFKDFVQVNQIPFPLISAVVSVYAQFICGILILIGYKIRIAAVIMMINFAVAIIFVHWGQPYPTMFAAIFMWFGSLFFLFNGDGALSVDQYLQRRKQIL